MAVPGFIPRRGQGRGHRCTAMVTLVLRSPARDRAIRRWGGTGCLRLRRSRRGLTVGVQLDRDEGGNVLWIAMGLEGHQQGPRADIGRDGKHFRTRHQGLFEPRFQAFAAVQARHPKAGPARYPMQQIQGGHAYFFSMPAFPVASLACASICPILASGNFRPWESRPADHRKPLLIRPDEV